LLSASPTIQNTSLTKSGSYGLYTSNSTPTLVCDNMYNNSTYGLYNATPSVMINAENQWWGSVSGPYHPTLNPTGTGNAVSNGVDFIPWRTVLCGPLTAPVLTVTSVTETQINLTWTDTSPDELDFYIERSPNGIDWTRIYTSSANTTTYYDVGLPCSTIYYHRVGAHYQSNILYSNTTNAKTASCHPTNLTATVASRTQIELSWQDNSPDESHFYIERSPNGTTGWSQITATGADVTSFSSTGLWCGTTYFYRMRAYRQSDGQPSDYTNVASNLTLPCLKVYIPTALKN
jgi:hypothetical protein